MNRTRIIDAAMGAAWAMEEPALRQLLEIAHRENSVTPEALEAYKAATLEGAEAATVRNGVAIIGATGPMFKRANLMTALSGATSYDVLMRDFTTALDDGNVRAILWNVDSPGGEVAGCAELAQAIVEARGTKPIVSYVGDLAASAAYWLASACDAIYVGPSAAVGSIGVRMSLTDASARDARSGLRRYDFVSSQSPYKVLDPNAEDGSTRLQARVDSMAKVFVETVAANRKVPVAKVLDAFGQGDVLIGQAAVNAGMVDGVASFESVLASLAKSKPPDALAFLRTTGKSPAAPVTAADREFERVRAAALARIAAEDRVKAAAEAARAAEERENDAAFDAVMQAMAMTRGEDVAHSQSGVGNGIR